MSTQLKPTDFGTPASHSDQQVTLEIDGQSVTVPEGTSVMRAALESGIDVPKLCASDNLEPFGSCRHCLGEVEGKRGYPASCTMPVAEGMEVRTQSDKLNELRRGVVELYLSDHPGQSVTPDGHGDDELLQLADQLGVTEVRYGRDGANHQDVEPEAANP